MDVWECDILDVQSLAKYNDMHRCILSVNDVFSNYLHLISVKTKSGPSIASAFRSIFHDDDDYRRPVWVRTDKGKEFLNKQFQDVTSPRHSVSSLQKSRCLMCGLATCSQDDTR